MRLNSQLIQSVFSLLKREGKVKEVLGALSTVALPTVKCAMSDIGRRRSREGHLGPQCPLPNIYQDSTKSSVKDVEWSDDIFSLLISITNQLMSYLAAATMDLSGDQVAHEYIPYFRAYKDGRVERFFGSDRVPAAIDDPDRNGVCSKDVIIVSETGVSARIFIPAGAFKPGQQLPLVVYYHGGGFFMGSPFCSVYNNSVSSLAAKANAIVVSVDYRLAPEHYIPVAYEDSWAALKWVASHFKGQGPEAWLNNYVDFHRVFLAGDSAGGNMVHNMAIQASVEDLNGVKLSGICLIQPYFGRQDGVVDKCWTFVCPTTSGSDDYRINPSVDSRLASLQCARVLVCIAEKDDLKGRGLFYYETLRDGEWVGEVEIAETEGEDHVFHLFNPSSERAVALMEKIASFIDQRNGG